LKALSYDECNQKVAEKSEEPKFTNCHIFSTRFFFHPSYMVVEKGWLWLQDAVMPVVYGTLVTMLKNGIFEKM
jgi:hypothetical protein